MRLQLEMAGVKVTLPTIRPTGTIRKRTAADVTVMTADMVIEEARKQAEQAALPADAQTAPQS